MITNPVNPTIWLLGLPFDVITLEEASERVAASAISKNKLNIITPNLNFLRTASVDTKFEKALLPADLSLADGTPVAWLARILGIKTLKRVAGSDLFELLLQGSEAKLNIYFFGGQEGVAAEACAQINQNASNLNCVGSLYPGFGDVQALSRQEYIQAINTADVDFLVVSLGANKGISWIDVNIDKLNAPVISHLGAVVNFVAGTVKRAPRMFQKTGLEWLWRLSQEPGLLSRYLADFSFLVTVLFSSALPLFLKHKVFLDQPQTLKLTHSAGKAKGCNIQVSGSLTEENCAQLERMLLSTKSPVVLDLQKLNYIDAFGLGLIYKLRYRLGREIFLVNTNRSMKKLIKLHKAEVLFERTGRPDEWQY